MTAGYGKFEIAITTGAFEMRSNKMNRTAGTSITPGNRRSNGSGNRLESVIHGNFASMRYLEMTKVIEVGFC